MTATRSDTSLEPPTPRMRLQKRATAARAKYTLEYPVFSSSSMSLSANTVIEFRRCLNRKRVWGGVIRGTDCARGEGRIENESLWLARICPGQNVGPGD